MIEQDGVGATVYHRRRPWTHDILIADSLLVLSEVGVELPLAELYEGVVFGEEPVSDNLAPGEPS